LQASLRDAASDLPLNPGVSVGGLQNQMVEILKEVLGHHLFVPEADQLAKDGKWLSPQDLKHKVVVRMKVKPGEANMP
jgi:hypothetical protein